MSVYLKDLIRRTKNYGDLVETHQGGLAYAVDPWIRLRRFLILGSDADCGRVVNSMVSA